MDSESALPTPDAAASPPAAPRRMLLTAFFGTLALTGLGHVLVGHLRHGLLWFAAYATAIAFAAAAVMLHAPVIVLFAGIALCTGAQLGALVDSLFCGWRPRWQWGEWWSRGLVVLAAMAASTTAVYQGVGLWKATLFETYVIPTNGMMPALIGESVWGTCPECGQDTPVSPRDPYERPRHESDSPMDWARGICTHCGAMFDDRAYTERSTTSRTCDRIVVTRHSVPRRWDMLVFRYPEVPSEVYVMRLVGLPGERFELRDGEVTINGRVVPKPEHLSYLKYLNFEEPHVPRWGQTGHPVTLGPDEYFVLGDFSARSKDSRLWERGAPGHPPYAVPKDHAIGIVSEIYWPPERWRVFERAEED